MPPDTSNYISPRFTYTRRHDFTNVVSQATFDVYDRLERLGTHLRTSRNVKPALPLEERLFPIVALLGVISGPVPSRNLKLVILGPPAGQAPAIVTRAHERLADYFNKVEVGTSADITVDVADGLTRLGISSVYIVLRYHGRWATRGGYVDELRVCDDDVLNERYDAIFDYLTGQANTTEKA